MPFAKQTELKPNPSIKIFFIGLNILSSPDGKTCQTFVHNSSREHKLSIEVRRKRPGKPDVLMMRHLGPLALTGADPSRHYGLLIETSGIPESDKGVKAYDGTVHSSEGTQLYECFRLAHLLGKMPEVDKFGGLPGIFIDHGVFYTAAKVKVKARLVKANGHVNAEFEEVPTIIGANIYLDHQVSDHVVNLFWRQEGKDVHLPLTPSANFTYEIFVVNEPLFEEDSPDLPRHGEFNEYFKILPDVKPEERFEIEFLEDIPEKGSTRTPCMSVLLSE